MSDRPSPLPNRVTPFGDPVAYPARGAWLGNRGSIHRGWRIARRSTTEGWVTCVLSFKGRRRAVMTPGRYTELFFLDEATALAAGHRPCFECRREDALRFAAFWAEGRGMDRPARAKEMDAVLKEERRHIGSRRAGAAEERRARAPEIAEVELARGAMATDGADAFLFDGARLWRWSFDGYSPSRPSKPLRLLTPPSIHAALKAGYRAAAHASAEPRG